MARVELPADRTSPIYEIGRVAEIDDGLTKMREEVGMHPGSILLANLHHSPYWGASAVYAGDGDPLTCAVAWVLGFDKLIVAPFPNVVRWGYDGYDLKNMLFDVGPEHPLYHNPVLWAERLGALAVTGYPLDAETQSKANVSVRRFLHVETISETEALDLGLAEDYGQFQGLSKGDAAALGYNPRINHFAVTWGDHFPGVRGEIVRRM